MRIRHTLAAAWFVGIAVVGCIQSTVAARPLTGITASSNQEVSLFDVIHKKAELPGPGYFVANPRDKALVYFYTNTQLMWGNKDNFKKHAGLYISRDRGDTWRLLCYIFEFYRVFVHPETGHLFAIIEYTKIEETTDGFLQRSHSNKAITSEDGRKWKNITGKQGYITGLSGIFADPDNPGRVCLTGSLIRGYVFQSRDENYTDWIWHVKFGAEGKRLLEKSKTEK